MKSTIPRATGDKLLDEFNAVLAETEQLLATVTTAGGEKADAIRASVGQGLADATARLARIRESAMDQASAAADATDEYVHDNPWRALGIAAALAAAAGLIVGLMATKR